MGKKPHTQAADRSDTSKHRNPKVGTLSVTEQESVTVKLRGPGSQHYARLEPWLRFMNLLPQPKKEPSPWLPNAEIWAFPFQTGEEFWRRVEAAHLFEAPEFKELRKSTQQRFRVLLLAQEISRTLNDCADVTERYNNFESQHLGHAAPNAVFLESLGTAYGWVKIRGGICVTGVDAPFVRFLDALEGVEAARIRRCQICSRIFYALPIDRKACSKRCNQTRRVRAWRKNQQKYEQTRKYKPAGVTPQDLGSRNTAIAEQRHPKENLSR